MYPFVLLLYTINSCSLFLLICQSLYIALLFYLLFLQISQIFSSLNPINLFLPCLFHSLLVTVTTGTRLLFRYIGISLWYQNSKKAELHLCQSLTWHKLCSPNIYFVHYICSSLHIFQYIMIRHARYLNVWHANKYQLNSSIVVSVSGFLQKLPCIHWQF